MTRWMIRTVLMMAAGVGLVGCATTRVPLSTAIPEGELPAKPYNTAFALLLDPEFATQSVTRWSPMGMAYLKYPLGEVSSSILTNTLKRCAVQVVVATEKPPFKDVALAKALYTVYPQITDFTCSHDALANGRGEYRAEIELFVTVYAANGTVVWERIYRVTGLAKAKSGVPREANFAAAADIALRRAVTQLVEELGRLPGVAQAK
jgi:hypothetical protein